MATDPLVIPAEGELPSSPPRADERERFLQKGLLLDSVQKVLESEKEPGPDAEAILRDRLERVLGEPGPLQDALLETFVYWEPMGEEARALELHPHDARAATALETMGEEGKVAATKWRELAAAAWFEHTRQLPLMGAPDEVSASWRSWCESMAWRPRYARTIARVLWRAEVAEQVQRERKKPAALTMAVYEPVLAAHRADLRVEELGGQRVLFNRAGQAVAALASAEVPTVDLEASGQMLPRGVERLGTIDAHRLLRWEILTGHRQVLAEQPDPRRIEWEGGWAELPNILGGGKRDELRLVVLAQAHLRFTWPDGSRGNMLQYNEQRATGRRKGRVSIVLGDVLMPGYVNALRGESRQRREGRRLVPIVELPPLVGRPNEHGAQAAYQLALVAAMRRRAVELFQEGSVLFLEDELAAMASDVGLSSGLWKKVIDRWTSDGDDGRAFLENVERDRFTLGPAHSVARDYIVQAGKLESAGAEAGRRGVAKKKAGRFARRRTPASR